MRFSSFSAVMLTVLLGVSSDARAGVIYSSQSAPIWANWFSSYGIEVTGGLYFGYTDNPALAGMRDLIPISPKFPNVTFDAGGSMLLVGALFPDELWDFITGEDPIEGSWIAEVPLGTTLTFPEGPTENFWYSFYTFYHDVNGVPTPFEEFRPLTPDGPDQYIFDQPGVIDLAAFSFNLAYGEPGLPAFPELIHIHVLPEPGSLIVLTGLVGPVVAQRSRRSTG